MREEKNNKTNQNIAIIIPARMKSTRLPNKPLADIKGKPMVLQVLDRARETGLGDAFVACSEDEVYDLVTQNGGKAIMTDPELPSGTDRVSAALTHAEKMMNKRYDIIINLQGDLPTIPASVVKSVIKPFDAGMDIDVATLVVRLRDGEVDNPHAVKAALSFDCDSEVNKNSNSDDNDNSHNIAKALYFSRSPLKASDGNIYHHIGLYAYKRDSLAKFVSLSPSPMERFEKLEQLRGIENGMRFAATVVDWEPFEVNTKEDLEKI